MYPNQNIGSTANNPTRVPMKVNSYLAIIEKCHQMVAEIGQRVDIMRSPVEVVQKDRVPSRNTLERELENLFSNLVELKDSINN